MHWGVSAFGGKLFTPEGRVILDEGGMADWLKWLAEAQTNVEVIIAKNSDALRARFAAGEVAYLIDRPQALAELEQALAGTLRVARLPAGPVNDAAPLLLTTGFAFRNGISTAQTQLASAFVAYATNLESQTRLVEAARLLPANIAVPIAPTDPLAVFAEQAGTSVPYPNRAQMGWR